MHVYGCLCVYLHMCVVLGVNFCCCSLGVILALF